MYLQKVEKIIAILRRKKGDTRVFREVCRIFISAVNSLPCIYLRIGPFRYSTVEKRFMVFVYFQPDLRFAELGVQCLCDMLKENHNFNFSKNIVHLLVPYLNAGNINARNSVSSCIKNVFKSDTRGEISLEVSKIGT